MPPEWFSAFWSGDRQWALLLPVALALVLSMLIGLEREAGAKSAGLRTHALVGVGAAVFMLISKYGFADLLDPSRVAAQIVSGIGFIGGGLIFVRQDAVRGLTTAATIWLVAAVGRSGRRCRAASAARPPRPNPSTAARSRERDPARAEDPRAGPPVAAAARAGRARCRCSCAQPDGLAQGQLQHLLRGSRTGCGPPRLRPPRAAIGAVSAPGPKASSTWRRTSSRSMPRVASASVSDGPPRCRADDRRRRATSARRTEKPSSTISRACRARANSPRAGARCGSGRAPRPRLPCAADDGLRGPAGESFEHRRPPPESEPGGTSCAPPAGHAQDSAICCHDQPRSRALPTCSSSSDSSSSRREATARGRWRGPGWRPLRPPPSHPHGVNLR